MSNPKISVIVPVYNAESTIRRCVDSILAQTFTDFECLLINDGSKDRSGEICDEYAEQDSRIRVFHQENRGPSSARNLGLDFSNGKYVMFVDADDFFLKENAFSILISYADNKALDIIRFDYAAVNNNGYVLRLGPVDVKKHLWNRVLSPIEMVNEAVRGEWFSWLYLVNRSSLGELRFDENRRFQEDTVFWATLFASETLRCGYMPEHLYAYCQTDHSLSRSSSDSNFECSFALCDVFSELADIAVNKGLKDIYRYNSVMMYYWTLDSVSAIPNHSHRTEIIRKYNVNSIHSLTLRRLKNVKGIGKYLLFIIPSPTIAIRLLRLKTRIVALMKSL